MKNNDADINKPPVDLERMRILFEGYNPKDVPLCGRFPVAPKFCRCSDDVDYEDQNRKDCGCAFGQCAEGLIY